MQTVSALIYTLLGGIGHWLNGGAGRGWGALTVLFIICPVVAVRYLQKKGFVWAQDTAQSCGVMAAGSRGGWSYCIRSFVCGSSQLP